MAGRKMPRSREEKKPGTEQQTSIVSKHRPSRPRCSYSLLSHHRQSIQPQLGLFIFPRRREETYCRNFSRGLRSSSLLPPPSPFSLPFSLPRDKTDLGIAHLPFISTRNFCSFCSWC